MIPFVRRRPIRLKVALLIAMAAVAGLLLAGVAVVIYELRTFRPRAVSDVRTQAELIRVNSVPALQFDDTTAARENLGTLASRPEILSATLFRADGSVLARYAPAGAPPPPERIAGVRFFPGRMVLVDSIAVDGNTLTCTMAKPCPYLPYWGSFPATGPSPADTAADPAPVNLN